MQKIIIWAQKYDLSLILAGTFLVRLPSLFFYTRSDFPEFYRDYFMVSKIVGGSLVLAGPGSILGGYHFGALYYYLFVPCYFLLNHHPASLLLTSIIFSMFSVWGLYRMVFVWTQNKVATRLVSMLGMLSVYSIFLTSFVSNPNLLPAFVVWALYHLTIILDNKAKLSNFISLGLLVGIASQLHTTALFVLIPLVVITLVFKEKKIEIKNMTILFLSFIFSNILYLYFEISVRFQNLMRLLDLASSNLRGSHVLNNFNAITNFFVGSLSPFSRYYPFTNLQFGWLYIIVGVFGLFILVLVLKNILQGNIEQNYIFKLSKSGARILILWFSLALLMVLSYNRVIPNHYLVVLWPFPLIIFGFGLIWFYQKFKVAYPVILFVFLIFIFQVNSYYSSPKKTWSNFYQRYELYRVLPDISEIGDKGYEPYVVLPNELK